MRSIMKECDEFGCTDAPIDRYKRIPKKIALLALTAFHVLTSFFVANRMAEPMTQAKTGTTKAAMR